ncbi:MAG: hypothetical protein ACXWP0_06800 [Ktedonobacterales bacterium]
MKQHTCKNCATTQKYELRGGLCPPCYQYQLRHGYARPADPEARKAVERQRKSDGARRAAARRKAEREARLPVA